MTIYKTRIKDCASDELVEAELHATLRLDDVYDAEAEWAVPRIRLRQLVRKAGLTSRVAQSLHWDWSKKAGALNDGRLAPLGDARVVGIRHADQWQGIIWLETCDLRGAEHRTRLGNDALNLVYVPWLEIAPWNWDVPPDEPERAALQGRRFRGLGMQLLESAVLWSQDLEFKGRVGLHALPQSERFYQANCGMTDLGSDTEHQDLRYFEFDEKQANNFLEGN